MKLTIYIPYNYIINIHFFRKINLVLLFFFAFILFINFPVFAHYPFPCTEEEKTKANEIEIALKMNNQEGINNLATILLDENPRVQTAALLAIGKLGTSGLNTENILPIVKRIMEEKEDERSFAYRKAAAKCTLILLDTKLNNDRKQEQLIELTSNDDGATRRMAIEGLKVVGNEKCLSALEKRINDFFGDHDDSFDMKAVARIAFEKWWTIKGKDLTVEQQIQTLISSLEEAQPFASRWGDAACKILEEIGYAAVPLLIETCKNESGNTKEWAARTLSSLELQEKDIEEIRKIAIPNLRNENYITRLVAVPLIEKYLNLEDVDMLVDLLGNHKDSMVRNFAITNLERFGGEKAIKALQQALKDNDELIRVNAAKALAVLGIQDGHDILLNAFGSLDFGSRTVSLGAIKLLDENQAFNRIIELLRTTIKTDDLDTTKKIIVANAKADLLRVIDEMPQQKIELIMPELKALLKYPDSSVSERAANLLKKLDVPLKWQYDLELSRGWYEVQEDQ